MMKIGIPSMRRFAARLQRMIVYNIWWRQNKLNEVLKDVTRISLTTDLWRSQNQKIKHMVITGHFIDKIWTLHKQGSQLCPCASRCSVDIADAMHKCLTDQGIENKIFTVSMDNNSYNDVCLRILKEDLSRNRKLACGGKMFQVRCCPHILNLPVQDGISAQLSRSSRMCKRV